MTDEWVGRVGRAIERRGEALEFLARARERFPGASPAHAALVSELWEAAEATDEAVCHLLERLNQGLLHGSSEVEVTRGASIQPVRHLDPLLDPGLGTMGPENALPQDTLVYECAWSLSWEDGRRGVAVRLLADPRSGERWVVAHGRSSPESRELPYPLEEGPLQDALERYFVAEATQGTVEREMEAHAAEMEERERQALREAAAREAPPRRRGRRRAGGP